MNSIQKNNRMIAMMIILLTMTVGMGLSGCASKPQMREIEPLYQPIDLTFSNPLNATIPQYDPISVEDFIRVGLFYFNKEQYASAAMAFHQANARIVGNESQLARQCLIASAICYLILDDRENFQKTTGQLKASYNRYQLMDIDSLDKRVSTLLSLSEDFDS